MRHQVAVCLERPRDFALRLPDDGPRARRARIVSRSASSRTASGSDVHAPARPASPAIAGHRLLFNAHSPIGRQPRLGVCIRATNRALSLLMFSPVSIRLNWSSSDNGAVSGRETTAAVRVGRTVDGLLQSI